MWTDSGQQLDHVRVSRSTGIPARAEHREGGVGGEEVLRVVALSGGYSTDDACDQLEKNPGMIASFSRGLLQDLRKGQSAEEFDGTLGKAIDQIQAASVAG